MAAGMPTIIGLAFLLATGILLVILSCALDNNWLTLLVLVSYILAPLPNIIAKRIAGGSSMSKFVGDDFYNDDSSKGVLETGYFITAMLFTSGFGLPLVLNHAQIITDHSMIMSLIGGVLIYATIMGYIHFFSVARDDQY